MASVHVQYNSGSEDSDLNDDFTGQGTSEGDDDDPESDNECDTSQNQHSHDESSDEDADTDEHSQSKSGLADVMSKILRKPVPKNKQVVLARGQTDREIQRKRKERKTESDKKSDKVKKKTTSDSDDSEDDSLEARKKYREKKKQRIEWEDLARVKPDVLEKDKERSLQKIATRGVVQLFNAVRQQQSMLGDKLAEAGSSERRREKVLGSANKKNFLTLLDGTTAQSLSTKSKLDKTKASRGEDDMDGKSGSWSILREDFMMGAKMKDWDRVGDSDGEGGGGDDVVSDRD